VAWEQAFGRASLAVLYGIFVLFPLPRFYAAPHFLGYRAAVYIGVLGSVCQEIILFVAAVLVWKSLSGRDSLSHKAALITRWTFGFCSVVFGLGHLTAIDTVAPMIPKWIPLGPTFWVVLTRIAFVLAGLAIALGMLDVLAARLLGLMLLVFSALALMPLIFTSPREHACWGTNAYNLTAVGAAWIAAEWLKKTETTRRSAAAYVVIGLLVFSPGLRGQEKIKDTARRRVLKQRTEYTIAKLNEVVATLVVRDYVEAKEFYCDILRFSVVEDSILPSGKRWVRLRAPGKQGSEILLSRAANDKQRASVGNQTGGRVLFLHTDDFDSDYRSLCSKGVEFTEGPWNDSYGKMAVFKDLYGNRIDLIQPSADA
jgi:predicted enzyme related to lactoylglutathione lyase